MMAVEKRSYRRLCPSFCALVATVEGERILSITPDAADPRFLPDGRWNFGPADLLGQVAEAHGVEGELLLTPRRRRNKLNGLMSDGLVNPRRPPKPDLLINPADAAERGIADGNAVRISTATDSVVPVPGSTTAVAGASCRCRTGCRRQRQLSHRRSGPTR